MKSLTGSSPKLSHPVAVPNDTPLHIPMFKYRLLPGPVEQVQLHQHHQQQVPQLPHVPQVHHEPEHPHRLHYGYRLQDGPQVREPHEVHGHAGDHPAVPVVQAADHPHVKLANEVRAQSQSGGSTSYSYVINHAAPVPRKKAALKATVEPPVTIVMPVEVKPEQPPQPRFPKFFDEVDLNANNPGDKIEYHDMPDVSLEEMERGGSTETRTIAHQTSSKTTTTATTTITTTTTTTTTEGTTEPILHFSYHLLNSPQQQQDLVFNAHQPEPPPVYIPKDNIDGNNPLLEVAPKVRVYSYSPLAGSDSVVKSVESAKKSVHSLSSKNHHHGQHKAHGVVGNDLNFGVYTPVPHVIRPTERR